MCVFICWASFKIKRLSLVLNIKWFYHLPVHTWVPVSPSVPDMEDLYLHKCCVAQWPRGSDDIREPQNLGPLQNPTTWMMKVIEVFVVVCLACWAISTPFVDSLMTASSNVLAGAKEIPVMTMSNVLARGKKMPVMTICSFVARAHTQNASNDHM